MLAIGETLQIQFGHTIFFLYRLIENKKQIIEIDYIENALSWSLWCSCGYVLDILGKPFKLIQVWTCFELFCVQGYCCPLACALRFIFGFWNSKAYLCFCVGFLGEYIKFLDFGLGFLWVCKWVTFGSMYFVTMKVFVVLCLIVNTIIISVGAITHNIIIILVVAKFVFWKL